MIKNNKGILIIAGTIVAVLLAVISGIFIFSGDSRSAEEKVFSDDVTIKNDSDETLLSKDTESPSKDTIVTESSSAVSEDFYHLLQL